MNENRLTKATLAKELVSRLGKSNISHAAALTVVDEVIDIISEAIVNSHDIHFKHAFSITYIEKPPRTLYNIHTHQMNTVQPTPAIVVNFSKTLKDKRKQRYVEKQQ